MSADLPDDTPGRDRSSRGGPQPHTSLLRRPAAAPLASLAVLGAGAAYLWGTNPHEPGHWLPRCPFNWLTGQLCPACGATRMCYDILHGDFVAAFHDNAVLFLLGLPLTLFLYGRWVTEGLRGRKYHPAIGLRGQAAIIGVALTWAVVRNAAM
ncbi:DUF2752 domain-containing protein [Streptomyces sp. AP-93]|uniref:DUF2752 domain-containing protein n=1 Tax=Streptomyces sp. AP-93 TaxID=2929048 RepID=UPI001FAF042A|nr:DUF2752 domain-containing protein [Streptomyces sp. AP-93]MCJ0867986.1 DUF2752 domain-containing protein [Streptomyces sp. AP-93]